MLNYRINITSKSDKEHTIFVTIEEIHIQKNNFLENSELR